MVIHYGEALYQVYAPYANNMNIRGSQMFALPSTYAQFRVSGSIWWTLYKVTFRLWSVVSHLTLQNLVARTGYVKTMLVYFGVQTRTGGVLGAVPSAAV